MKKCFAVLSLMFAVFALGGCRYPTEADFIPEKMGVSDDGLWLYRSDLTRCRSDGSGVEPLPLQTQIDGGDAELAYWSAETDAHTLFYVLTQGEEERVSALRVYDYETKRDEELIPAFSGEFAAVGGQLVRAGGGYVFAHAQKTGETDEYFLFDLEGDLLFQTEIDYDFDEKSGLLRRIKQEQDLEDMKNRTTFRYYFEGREDEAVLMSDSYFWREFTAGGWSYLLFLDGSVVAIDLTTGEQKEGTLPPWDELHQYDEDYVFTAGGAVYVFCYREIVPPYGLDCAELYALKDGKVLFLRAFGETFVEGFPMRVNVQYPLADWLALSLTTRELNKSSLYLDDSLGFSNAEPTAEEDEGPEKFTCGEYTFWVEKTSWVEGFMGPVRYCYYLWRQKGTEEPEIMQYKFRYGNVDPSTDGFYYYDILPV